MSTTLRASIVTVFLLAASRAACAQTGAASVTLTGQVSAAISVSVTEARAAGEQARVSAANIDANTVAVSISGSGNEDARVHLPLRLRSNVGYGLRASFVSPRDLTVRLSVADVRATGRLVHANALTGIRLDDALAADARGVARSDARGDALDAQGDARAYARGKRAASLTIQNPSPHFAVLSGPPVSKAGTFNSPDNAIEIVLTIELRPHAPKQPWSTQLTITAAPNR